MEIILLDVDLCLSYGTGAGAFITLQPQNTTVNFGEILEFNCSVRNYTNYGLEMFVGYDIYDAARIFPKDDINEEGRNFIESLHRGEFYAAVEPAENCTATSCEGRGIFWMVANGRTLPLMDFFWCRATHNGQHEDSNEAFVEILYPPECVLTVNRTMSLATINKPANVTTTEITYFDNITATTNSGSQNQGLNLSGFFVYFSLICLFVFNVHG